MAKILNLDELAPEEKQLKLKGEGYSMKEMSVDDFISITRKAEKIEKDSTDMPMSDRVEFLMDMVCDSFPTCPRDDLRGLNLEQLNAIIEFARGDMDKEAKEGDEKGKK